ncbi:histidine kinase dimerization/phospho-acceptor domain-containing protein [Rubellimicrobium roseum]|uniref:histidine kinase dimerization/phospho-acceptor domain-containing protein n=1 Tax=Rubellimicrobium roseum TaxID=687525 RepID=UPI001C3F1F6D|nr:histidine kinase dimerization/phospho-acceptor domain-containing protein [Rubellimicrobium roseum]
MYTEYLDRGRFSSEEYGALLSQFFAEKYFGVPLDVIIAQGPGSLSFVLGARNLFAPGTPMVAGAVTESGLAGLDLPEDVSLLVSQFDLQRTVDFAIEMQPDASRIVVLTGSAPFDERWEATAREVLGEVYEGRPVSHMTDLTIAGFRDAAAALDRDTVLVFLTVFADAGGAKLVPLDVAAQIAEVAGAPMYSVYSTPIGVGAVGGYVETFGAIGERTVELALRVIEDPDAAPLRVENTSEPVVDWRALRRWGIDEGLLPEQTRILFYEPGLWERYWLEILAVSSVIVLQSSTIVGLILSERRRRLVSAELAEGRVELVRLSRRQQLGQLTGAIAHELNQPLTAILANAETGLRLMRRTRPTWTRSGRS